MNTKKIVFFTGLLGMLFLAFLFFLDTKFCYAISWCMNLRRNFNGDIFQLIFIFPPVFLFSLLTYWMREEIFRAWWNFARWWVPIIIAVTLLLEFGGGGGGGMGISGAVSGGFDIFVIGIFYAIFIIVSLYKIARAHDRLKQS